MNNICICELNNINYKLTQNYKMGEGLFFPINNKVVEVKKYTMKKLI